MLRSKSLLKLLNISAKTVSEARALRRCHAAVSKHKTTGNNSNPLVIEKYKTLTVISLNRTQHKNAINQETLQRLNEALVNFENDTSSQVAILNGYGGNFSAGYDIEELRGNESNIHSLYEHLLPPFELTRKPTICSISGSCKGIAFELALLCDIRIIEESSILGFTNRKLGMPLMADTPQRLVQLVGLSKATELILVEQDIAAKEALDMGLVFKVTSNGSCLGSGINLGIQIASYPEAALIDDKRLLHTISNVNRKRNEKRSLTPDMMRDISMALQTKETRLSQPTAKKTTKVMDLEKLPDWERDEYQHEMEYMRKMNENPK